MLRFSFLDVILPLKVALLMYTMCVEASVHVYAGEKFVGKGNAFVVHGGSEGVHFSTPELDESVPDISFIRFEKIIFRRSLEFSNFTSGPVHAILFEVEDRETIGGSAYGGQRAVCCTADLGKLGVCLHGEIIHRPSVNNPGWPQVYSTSFDVDTLEASLRPRTIQITKTGMYNLYFIHCDPRLKEIRITGKSVWKNPTGYLPGRMAPLMRFYGLMSLAFVILGLFWFLQYARFWKEVLPLQNCITLVITLGTCEMAFWYFDYADFNLTGVRPTGITVWAVTIGTVKRTVSRLIILIVSMGYGVVRPTLGGLTSKVLLLGGTFFVASEVLELIENVGTVSDLSGKARLFFVLPVAVLDAFFILWIFTSLSSTLDKLQARKMTAKLEIYKKFTNALAVAVIMSVGWICYELFFKSNDVYNQRWQQAWIIPAFWLILSFSLLCVLCFLWAPSQNSTRFAYSHEDADEEFDKDSTMTLLKTRPLVTNDSKTPELKSMSLNSSSHSDFEEEKTA